MIDTVQVGIFPCTYNYDLILDEEGGYMGYVKACFDWMAQLEAMGY